MAYLTQYIFPGLCLYPAGREPLLDGEIYPQHGCGLVPDRDVARRKLELYSMGNLLSGVPAAGALCH